jgi:hypothetical protein
MDQNNNVRSASIRLSTVATTTRQTPKTDFGTVMRDGLIRAGGVVADGLQVAAPFVPGGAIVSAALAGANTAAGYSGGGGGFGGGAQYMVAEGGAGTRGFGTSASGLAAGSGGSVNAGASSNSYGSGNTLAIPGRRPGLETNLSQSPSNFSSGGSATGTTNAGDSFNQMMASTKQMSEFQASFNLQYLQLQEKIQIDTRQFNLVSNIMKTKHDAAKNALNNVR